MPNGNSDLVRKPDEDSGPAALGREPVILPEVRKNIVDRIKRMGE